MHLPRFILLLYSMIHSLPPAAALVHRVSIAHKEQNSREWLVLTGPKDWKPCEAGNIK
ncbi:hypothetical protein AT6N2_C2255 [Agrobacterium tumefaciens]|nr:hypothetical protein AT6N2_C2255 [Agrobacterium tumefaciens]